jgi:hypothetical protein
MRHGSTNRRARNRGGGRGGNQNRTKVFDSNGPDVRIRGTAHQIFDKYTTLAKDAAASGDLVLAENYSQYAEHYKRIINRWQETLSHYDRTGIIEDFSTNKKDNRTAVDSRNNADNTAVENKDNKAVEEEDLGLPESISGVKTASKATDKSEELQDA